MKIPSDRTAQILLVISVLILLSAVFSGGTLLFKLILVALVAFLAWNMAGHSEGHSAFFANDTWRAVPGDEQAHRSLSYAFSNAVLDLTDSSALPEKLEIHAAFSNVSVRLPVDAGITLHSSCAFGSVSVPHQQGVVFGSRTATCGSHDPNAPQMRIDANCAFGAIDFRMG